MILKYLIIEKRIFETLFKVFLGVVQKVEVLGEINFIYKNVTLRLFSFL